MGLKNKKKNLELIYWIIFNSLSVLRYNWIGSEFDHTNDSTYMAKVNSISFTHFQYKRSEITWLVNFFNAKSVRSYVPFAGRNPILTITSFIFADFQQVFGIDSVLHDQFVPFTFECHSLGIKEGDVDIGRRVYALTEF